MVLCVLIQGLLPNSGGLLNDIGEKVTEGKIAGNIIIFQFHGGPIFMGFKSIP